MRQYSLRKGVMDNPNHRSSHVYPTPRGGGAAIVFAFLVGLLIQQLWFGFNGFLITLMLGALAVAAIGFVDDHRHVPARIRFLIHVLAATVVVLAVPSPVELDLGLASLYVTGMLLPLVALGVVWLLNLTNFMDGIDGIAGVQTCAGCGLVALLLLTAGAPSDLFCPPVLLALSSLGFLCWNFPPAKIFMGDVGSGTLGLLFGGLAWWHASADSKWLYVWLIILGVFVVDATYTLLRRAAQGEKLSLPHRSHAYQHATQRLGSHRKVTLGVLAIILLWLAPWAALVAFSVLNGMLALLIAYAPLLACAVYLRAGQADSFKFNHS
ncbi:glycosyltransferase family 4 protein [Limnobacter sp.]|uniref:MraY family glycosyltransferase n=1 Tax=Limnobacter sp. TaxID=2003368 RepID=UPI0035150A55